MISVNITVGNDTNTEAPITAGNMGNDTVTVHQTAPGGPSGAAIAGIIVGAIAGAVLIFFAVRKWVWKR